MLYYLNPLEWNIADVYPSWSATRANELSGTAQHGWEIEAARETCKLEWSPQTIRRTKAGVRRYLPSRSANMNQGPAIYGGC